MGHTFTSFSSGVAYNEQKESSARWEAKKKELARIDAAKKRALDKGIIRFLNLACDWFICLFTAVAS
jgi:hypothetical protein